MKRLLVYVLVMVTLLSGCTVHNGPDKPKIDKEPAEDHETEQVTPAKNDSGPFSRTEIIRRNEHADGYFLETKRWAADYAKVRWPNSEYTIDFVSGFEAPSAIFTDFLSGGSALWSVTISQPSAEKITETVQTLYFLDGGQIYLSGLLAGDAVMKSRPDVYNYLRLDTRYASRMCEAPTITPPQGLAQIHDLTQLIGTEGASAHVLDDDTVLITDLGWYRESGDYCLKVLDISTWEVLHERTVKHTPGTWSIADLRDGVITYANHNGNETSQTITASRRGVDLDAAGASQTDRWQMGQNRYVEFAGNSLYEITVNPETKEEIRRVLLQGVAADNDAASSFNFRKALSEDRFVYDYYGYEWFIRSGIYDLSTGEDFVVTVPVKDDAGTRQAPTRMLYVDADTAVTAVEDYGSYHFAVTDLNTGKTRSLQIGYESADTQASQAAANDKKILLTREPSEKKPEYTFELFNLQGKKLWSWTLLGSVTGSVSAWIINSNTIGVQFYNLLTGTTQLYVINI